MKNFVFVLFIILNFYVLVKCNDINLEELNYFVYILKDRNMILCSSKEVKNIKFLIHNNITENASSCMVDVRGNGFYKLNLHLKEVNHDTRLNFYEDLNENDSSSISKIVYIKLGDNKILKNVKYYPHIITTQVLFLKMDNGVLSFSNDDMCMNHTNISNCKFIPLPNFNSSNLQINFDFPHDSFKNNIILLEKQAKANSNSCNPPCVNGICYNSSCFCKNGYMGTNCSICKI
jgi:hypothetical protein